MKFPCQTRRVLKTLPLVSEGVNDPTNIVSAASSLGGTLTDAGSFPTSDIGTTTFNPATSTDSLGSSSGSTTASSSPSTVAEKWDNLSTGAHAGIYIGGGACALFLVVVSILSNFLKMS